MKAKFNTYLDQNLIKWVKLTAVKQQRRPAPLITDALGLYRKLVDSPGLYDRLVKEARLRQEPVDDYVIELLQNDVKKGK